MSNDKTLNDYFPDSITGSGLFTEIAKIEWFNGLTPSDFDTYFALTVGDKKARAILDKFTDSDGHVTGTKLTSLAKVIYNINFISWRNIYRDLTVKYNPIENTDFVETIKDKSSNTGKVEVDSTGGSERDINQYNNRYAFNSSSASPERHDVNTDVDTTTANSTTESASDGTYEREYRKHGNIGVTTNAQMITSDLEVWKNKCADYFIRDICDIIALSIY